MKFRTFSLRSRDSRCRNQKKIEKKNQKIFFFEFLELARIFWEARLLGRKKIFSREIEKKFFFSKLAKRPKNMFFGRFGRFTTFEKKKKNCRKKFSEIFFKNFLAKKIFFSIFFFRPKHFFSTPGIALSERKSSEVHFVAGFIKKNQKQKS